MAREILSLSVVFRWCELNGVYRSCGCAVVVVCRHQETHTLFLHFFLLFSCAGAHVVFGYTMCAVDNSEHQFFAMTNQTPGRDNSSRFDKTSALSETFSAGQDFLVDDQLR